MDKKTNDYVHNLRKNIVLKLSSKPREIHTIRLKTTKVVLSLNTSYILALIDHFEKDNHGGSI